VSDFWPTVVSEAEDVIRPRWLSEVQQQEAAQAQVAQLAAVAATLPAAQVAALTAAATSAARLGPGRFDLDIYRGDTHRWRFRFWQNSAHTQTVSLAGFTARAQNRPAAGQSPVIDLACALTQPNTIDVYLSPFVSQTAVTGRWDLELTSAAGVVTVIAGAVTVTEDITR